MSLEIKFNGPANTYHRRGRKFEKDVTTPCRDQAEYDYLMATGMFSDPAAPTEKKGGVKIVRGGNKAEADAKALLEKNVGMFQTKDDAVKWAANHAVRLDGKISLKRLNAATLEVKRRLEVQAPLTGIDGVILPEAPTTPAKPVEVKKPAKTEPTPPPVPEKTVTV